MVPSTLNEHERHPEVDAVFDAVVVGAGFAGLYMLHRLRGLGFTARAYEAGGAGRWATNHPPFRGREDVGGPVYHTGEWPHEGVDFTGQRVGIIGTGSSAIQLIPIIAQQTCELTVFQRTATYSVPAWNEKLTPEYRSSIKADYPALRAKARARPTGFYFPFNIKPALEATEQRRARQYQEAWERGGLPFLGAYGDLLFEKAANDTIAEFARRKIRSIVKDPATAELLCPDNVFGCKRLCVDTGYFETYNLPNVKLVDVSKTPIDRFTAVGIEVNGVGYPLDAIICDTGFAAIAGSVEKILITGRNGMILVGEVRHGPRADPRLPTPGRPHL